MNTTKKIQTETSKRSSKAENSDKQPDTKPKRRTALRSKHTFYHFPNDRVREINTKPSLAQPDQTMSVKQIYENHRRHMPMPDVPVYYESEIGFTSAVYDMDKQDRIEYMRTVKKQIDASKAEYTKKMYEKAEKEKEEQILAAKEQLIREQAANTQTPHKL